MHRGYSSARGRKRSICLFSAFGFDAGNSFAAGALRSSLSDSVPIDLVVTTEYLEQLLAREMRTRAPAIATAGILTSILIRNKAAVRSGYKNSKCFE